MKILQMCVANLKITRICDIGTESPQLAKPKFVTLVDALCNQVSHELMLIL